jgi:hypothetical protein
VNVFAWLHDNLSGTADRRAMGIYHTDDGLPPTFVANDPDQTRAILCEAFQQIRVPHWRFWARPAYDWNEALFLASVATDHLWAGTIIPSHSADDRYTHEGDEDQ